MMVQKIQNNGCFLSLYYLLPDLLYYIPYTFPQTSKCFHSNGTKNMHILALGPELQAVRFRYVIFGENWKKGVDP